MACSFNDVTAHQGGEVDGNEREDAGRHKGEQTSTKQGHQIEGHDVLAQPRAIIPPTTAPNPVLITGFEVRGQAPVAHPTKA